MPASTGYTIPVRVDPTQAVAGAKVANTALAKVGGTARAIVRTLQVTGGLLGGLTGAVAIAFASYQIAQFEEAMAKVKAVTGATHKEFTGLVKITRRLGATTVFTARQAADAALFLSRAGFTVAETSIALRSVLALARAGGIELEQAGDITANVLRGFGLAANQAARVANVLALGSARANTTIQELGQGIKFVAPVATAFGVSMEETTAVLAKLSDAGFKGSISGTGLRRILSGLTKVSGPAKKRMDQLGISMNSLDVSTRGILPVIQTLVEAGVGGADAFRLFGQRGGPAYLIMRNMIEAMGELKTELEDGANQAVRMARIMDDTLTASFKSLVSAISESILIIGDGNNNLNDLQARYRDVASESRYAADAMSFLAEEQEGLNRGVRGLLESVTGMLSVWNNMELEFAATRNLTYEQIGVLRDNAQAWESMGKGIAYLLATGVILWLLKVTAGWLAARDAAIRAAGAFRLANVGPLAWIAAISVVVGLFKAVITQIETANDRMSKAVAGTSSTLDNIKETVGILNFSQGRFGGVFNQIEQRNLTLELLKNQPALKESVQTSTADLLNILNTPISHPQDTEFSPNQLVGATNAGTTHERSLAKTVERQLRAEGFYEPFRDIAKKLQGGANALDLLPVYAEAVKAHRERGVILGRAAAEKGGSTGDSAGRFGRIATLILENSIDKYLGNFNTDGIGGALFAAEKSQYVDSQFGGDTVPFDREAAPNTGYPAESPDLANIVQALNKFGDLDRQLERILATRKAENELGLDDLSALLARFELEPFFQGANLIVPGDQHPLPERRGGGEITSPKLFRDENRRYDKHVKAIIDDTQYTGNNSALKTALDNALVLHKGNIEALDDIYSSYQKSLVAQTELIKDTKIKDALERYDTLVKNNDDVAAARQQVDKVAQIVTNASQAGALPEGEIEETTKRLTRNLQERLNPLLQIQKVQENALAIARAAEGIDRERVRVTQELNAIIEKSPDALTNYLKASELSYTELVEALAKGNVELSNISETAEAGAAAGKNAFELLIEAEQRVFDISQLSAGIEKERAKTYEEFLKLKLSGAEFFKDLDLDEIGRLSKILALQRETNEVARRKNDLRSKFNLKDGEEFTPLQQAISVAGENEAAGFSGGFNEEFRDSFLLGMEEMTAAAANPGKAFGDSMAQAQTTFSDSVSQVLTSALTTGDSVRDKFKEVGRALATSVVQSLIQIGVQMLITRAIGKTIQASVLASNVALSGTLLAIWTPAAVAASIATVGEANLAGAATLEGLGVLAAAAAAAASAGGAATVSVATGGYISGPGGPRSDSISAMLSDGEFVINARATKRHRGLLEAINSNTAAGFAAGGAVGGTGGRTATFTPGSINVTVENHTGEEIQVEQRQNSLDRRMVLVVKNAIQDGVFDDDMELFGAVRQPVD